MMINIKTLLAGLSALIFLQISVVAGEVPAALAQCFDVNKPVKAQVVGVVPPKGFEQFVQKLSEVAQKDPEWFDEHSKKTPAGSPVPLFHEKLGVSQEEYDAYTKLWDSREMKKLADITLLLEEVGDGEWKINGTAPASVLSLLRYNEKTNSFKSPNGELISIADVVAPKRSLLGAWKGKEWRYTSENALTQMKENVALGVSNNGKYSFLVYRIQEIATSGRPLFDQSFVIRFPAKKQK